MAQYKKDEIKEKINTAALNIFAEKGYENTSISDIAAKANISVGNIYRYYKGKDEIFYTIVPEDFIIGLKATLLSKIASAKDIADSGGNSHLFSLINDEFIALMVSNREIVLIILMGAKGTRYESVKDEVTNYLIKVVKENYSGKDNRIIYDSNHDLVIKMIYMNLLEMIMNILKLSNDLSEMQKSLHVINSYHLFGVTNLFK